MTDAKTAVTLLVAILLFALAGMRNQPLVDMRETYQLTASEAIQNAPPVIVFTTVVLGGFRGLVTDLLWLRLSALQDEAKVFEIVQLADWITKLEPRTPKVWEYHAWNMAYNVSSLMPGVEERWRWVRNGVELLRDEGLVYNPRDARLYFELGFFFQHKIGTYADPAQPHYRAQWAKEMINLLGAARPDYAALTPGTEVYRRMTEEYKLFPETMRELEAAYGPIDWTHPWAHSLYWAYRGLAHAEDQMMQQWLGRMVRQAVRELQGELPAREPQAALPKGAEE